MPPSPLYNLLCVVNAAGQILTHAAHIRAGQVSRVVNTDLLRQKPPPAPQKVSSGHDPAPEETGKPPSPSHRLAPEKDSLSTPLFIHSLEDLPAFNASSEPILNPAIPAAQSSNSGLAASEHGASIVQYNTLYQQHTPSEIDAVVERAETVTLQTLESSRMGEHALSIADLEPLIPESDTNDGSSHELESLERADAVSRSAPLDLPVTAEPSMPPSTSPANPSRAHILQSSRVPSSRIGRLFHYGGLAASLGYGAATEALRRSTGSSTERGGVMMSEANIRRLVSKLSQMRGAALKLGQFMSIQDTHTLPPEIECVFRRVQDKAHYMPDWQMEQVMSDSLGPTWSEKFTSLSRVPFAAASIGQVHRAVLSESISPSQLPKPLKVAVKVQFPNIAASITSDLSYLRVLLTASAFLPRGLFLDRTMDVMKGELQDECDYIREAAWARQFGEPDWLGNDRRYRVPWVWEGSTKEVLVMEEIPGMSVGEDEIKALPQAERNEIAKRVIELCFRELFQFRVMQTDPNFTNFLWDTKTQRLGLVDYGATRSYSKTFIDSWLRLLTAAASDDREGMIEWSRKVGYLTGQESDTMLDAHVTSLSLTATPFSVGAEQPFEFGSGSKWAEATSKIRSLIPVMLKERLTPPPRETYSLNRKLSGALLLCGRLGAKVDVRSVWVEVVRGYQFDTESEVLEANIC